MQPPRGLVEPHAGMLNAPPPDQLLYKVMAAETLASEIGMLNANHDIRFPRLGVLMDTKLLLDKTGQILDGIFEEFRSRSD